MKKDIFIGAILSTVGSFAVAQTPHGMGCLPEPDVECLPRQAELMTKDFDDLPSSFSLLRYCPNADSQGQYGTCTAWATGYAFRTILEAVNRGWSDRTQITDEAFSPLFIYAQIKHPNDADCSMGSVISYAFDKMKAVGAVKKRDFNHMCTSYVPESVLTAASPYKIAGYVTLVHNPQIMRQDAIVKCVKKALANKQPVVVSMNVYPSFNNCKDLWNGDMFSPPEGRHAMCVIGYDDNKYGGAVHIMNSWGSRWGNNGFVWVKHPDFCKALNLAYTGSLPFTPSPVINKNKFGGALDLTLSSGKSLTPALIESGAIPVYEVEGSFVSGTRFRLYITNEEPAFVYVIGFDSGQYTSLLFPPKENISPALTYKNSHVAIPDEKWFLEMDDNKGTDYICLLYSKTELDIMDIMSKIERGSGNLPDRVSAALGSKLAKPADIDYSRNSISFQAATQSTVVPVIASLSHE